MEVLKKDIAGFENYEIHSDGRVWSKRSGRFLSPLRISSGYLQVSLWNDGKESRQSIHRLVAHAFVSNTEGKPLVNHKDGVKTNNDVLNLEWATAGENIRHAVVSGLHKVPFGEKSASAKLTDGDVLDIRARHGTGCYKQKDLASLFGVSDAVVSNIVNRKSWKHVA